MVEASGGNRRYQIGIGSYRRGAMNYHYPRSRFAVWAVVYAFAIIYVSVVIGPSGFNFVPRDPVSAWHMLMATSYAVSEPYRPDPDWMANLLMLIPLGFLATGAC